MFYKHKRTGINYKEFFCYKYRSLTITQEIEGTYVMQNDKRVTVIGKFLRKTSIDELPQIFNILKGEMSFIGPRPPLTYFPKKLEEYDIP